MKASSSSDSVPYISLLTLAGTTITCLAITFLIGLALLTCQGPSGLPDQVPVRGPNGPIEPPWTGTKPD
jgi:hypothetical protein